jgi:hypothetical protein
VSTGLALISIATLVVATAAAWIARSRRLAQRARRVAALTIVAERLEAALESLREASAPSPAELPAAATPPSGPAPLIGGTLPGRAALVDALGRAVEHSRKEGARLTAAVVQTEIDVEDVLGTELSATANAQVYLVGPRAVALVFPDLGRAAALGVLARIQAAHGVSGRVVELAEDETAAELAVRLLGSGPSAD